MKKKSSSSPNWLIIVVIGVAFAMVVGVVKKFSSRQKEHDAQPVAAAKPTQKPKRAAKKAAPPVEPVVVEPAPAPAAPAEPEPVVAAEPTEPELAPVAEPEPEPIAEPDPLDEWRVRSNAVWSVNEAAAAGDMATLQERIQEGENVNARDELGNTPLHVAAAAGHAQAVTALLQAGADSMATNKQGKRPAELAANAATRAACEAGEQGRRRELALFDLLGDDKAEALKSELEAGVNPNALSADNQHSLLTLAAQQGRVAATRVLLYAGANPRYREPSSRYALNLAAGQGNVEVIRMLLEAGADPMAATNHGAYPIHDAIWSGRTAAAIALIPCYASINFSPDGKGNGFPISMAIGRGNRDIVRAFLEAGLKPNDPRFAREPLLVQAAKKNDAEMVRMLLAAGADKNAKDAQGKRAADYAAPELAKLLK